MWADEYRCHARVGGVTGPPTACPQLVAWAQDTPYDAWPHRRARSYWCDEHVWSQGSDPRRLTTEDVAVLRWRRARWVRAAEEIAETRRRAGLGEHLIHAPFE